jgi:hypothetical protein
VAATPGASGVGNTAIAGYRLTGNDMSSWVGQRVQIVGTVVRPTAPAGASASATGATGTAATTGAVQMPEFRVFSVQPTTGACPQR